MNANNNIIIRPAVMDDVDEIHALELECSKNPWTREGIADEVSNPNAVFLVLEFTSCVPSQKNQIVGFICSILILDELQILEVAIHPGNRKRGYGSMLIDNVLSMARNKNATRAILEVRVSNHPAISLYEKHNFTRDGIRKGYYQNGEDALLMSRGI